MARALYAQEVDAGGDATTLSVGEMSTLVAAARSNLLFARLLPRLLTPDMIAAVPANALVWHRVGTSHHVILYSSQNIFN